MDRLLGQDQTQKREVESDRVLKRSQSNSAPPGYSLSLFSLFIRYDGEVSGTSISFQ